MAKRLSQKLAAVVLFVLAIALVCTGIFGLNGRSGVTGQQIIEEMGLRSLLVATGEGVVESYVDIAKQEATAQVRAAGGSMAEIREAVQKAEEEARATYSNTTLDYDSVDTTQLSGAVEQLREALNAYYAEEAAAREAYADMMLAQMELEAASGTAEDEIVDEGPVSAEEDISDAEMELETEPTVDMSGFVATDEMNRLMEQAEAAYVGVSEALAALYEGMDAQAFDALQDTVMALVSQSGDTFETMFDRFQAGGGGEALTDDLWNARVIRYGDDLITVGIAVLLTALLVLFYQFLVTKLGLPRLIIGLFFLLLCVLGTVYDLSLPTLLSNSVVRMGMNSILVLAMVPGIQCGISLNLGLPLGIVGGLLGGLLCIELGYSGWSGFLFAIAVGILIAMVVGYLYGLLLNRLKGSEMAVTTYVGYSIVSLMCIAWMLLPFKSTVLRWPLGPGLRATLRLDSSYKHILNNLWSFEIGGFTVATGLLLFMALCCLLMWLFLRSKTGVAMSAAGNNPRFAEATGINVDKMRIIGTVLSTILGAVGIIVYSQSYGFMQLYTAPRQMGFIAASAILIGGASTSRCRISHVIIGTFLFQGVLTLGMPVANVLVPQSTISETLRILISNGIILYALTKSGGVSRA